MESKTQNLKDLENKEKKILLKNQKYIMNGKIQEFSNLIRLIDNEKEPINQSIKNSILTLYKNLELEISMYGVIFDDNVEEIILRDLRRRMKMWNENRNI